MALTNKVGGDSDAKSRGYRKLLLEIMAVGLAIIVASFFVDKNCQQWPEVVRKLIEHLGIAVFIVGAVGLSLETKVAMDHFLAMLAVTVVQRVYLNQFRAEELRYKIQHDVIRAYFSQEGIQVDEKGILKHFDKLFAYIGKPYREDTSDILSVAYEEKDGKVDKSIFRITDKTSYKCRKVGDSIEPEIVWLAEQEEIGDIKLVKVTLREGEAESWTSSLSADPENSVVVKEPFKAVEGRKGFILPLPCGLKGVDGLVATVEVEYTAPVARGIVWNMSESSNGVDIAIDYPDELHILVDKFGVDNDDLLPPPDGEPAKPDGGPGPHRKRHTLALKPDVWMLPMAGFAFHFVPN
jgi:hypothetical protein